MLADNRNIIQIFVGMAATAVMWVSTGAGAVLIVMGQYEAAAVLLMCALAAFPFRLKVRVRRITADSFEEAMRQIAEIEREDGRR